MLFKSLRHAGRLALPALCALPPAFAQSELQPNPYSLLAALDSVVVSAAKIEQSLSDVIPSITVINREKIDRSGANNLADLLQGEPGFEFGRNGGPGGLTSFFLRGADSRNVVIFVDDVRIRDAITQSSLAENIPLGIVDRIEILRGNVSALYGEGAVGGVIHIYTRRGLGRPKPYAQVTLGQRNSRDISFGMSGEHEGLSFRVGAQQTRTDGFSAMKPKSFSTPVNPDRDGYENQSADFSLTKKTRDVVVGLRGLMIRAKLDFDSNFRADFTESLATDQHHQRSSNDLFGFFIARQMTQGWYSRLDLDYTEIGIKASENDKVTDDNTTRQRQLRWFNRYQLNPQQTLVFGAEQLDLDRSPATAGIRSRDTQSFYAGHQWSRGAWSTQINLRNDDISTGQQKNTGLIGLGYQLSDRWRLTAARSTAFIAPDAFALQCGKDIQPETHDSLEAGLMFTAEKTSVRVVSFLARTLDQIAYAITEATPLPAACYGYAAQNLERVKNKGVEIEARHLAGAHEFRLALTIQNPVNESTDSRLLRRAREHGSAEWRYKESDVDLYAQLLFSGNRIDFSDRYDENWNPERVRLKAFQVLNIGGGLVVAPDWQLRTRIENVTNQRYELVYGYGSPPRGIFFTLQYQPR